jgi:hypothetical protein
MNRARVHIVATTLGVALAGLYGQSVSAQNPPEPAPTAPQFKSILAGKKIEPPLKGTADIEFMQPVTKRDKDKVITTIKVKNIANGPVARLTVDETWFDKGGAIVIGGKGFLKEPLKPGDVETVTIETPYNAKMNANSWNFSHANGPVKPHKVKSFDEPVKEGATKPAAQTTKAPAKTTKKK